MHIESLEVNEGCQGTAHENIDVDLKKSIKSILRLQIGNSLVWAH
jgi:hypothetical protein